MKKSTLTKCTLIVLVLCFGFAISFKTKAQEKVQAVTAQENFPHIDQSQYLGSEKCAACHKSHSESWQNSGHNKMIRAVIADGPNKNIQADFSKPDANRPFELRDVKWVIGHRWKQRFIGVVNGQEVVFPAQWSIKDKKWQAYTAKSDWWYPQHPDWKTRSNFQLCAGCHSTGSDHYSQSWTELAKRTE